MSTNDRGDSSGALQCQPASFSWREPSVSYAAQTSNGGRIHSSVFVARRLEAADRHRPSAIAVASTATQQQKFVVLNGCFIATAAFGSSMARELDTLRAVRDRALFTNALGTVVVAAYYAISPPIARAIATDERLRAGARSLLRPIIAAAELAMRHR